MAQSKFKSGSIAVTKYNNTNYFRINTSTRPQYILHNENHSQTLRRKKNIKAARLDEIPNEFIKYDRRQLAEQLTLLYKKIYDEKKVPQWKSSITIPLFKKGDKKILGIIEA